MDNLIKKIVQYMKLHVSFACFNNRNKKKSGDFRLLAQKIKKFDKIA